MTCKIREAGDVLALDMNFPFETVTIYFKSRQNAEAVKRIIEADWAPPIVTTDCGVREVVLCKDCVEYSRAKVNEKGFLICPASGMDITEGDYCSYGERRMRKYD